MFFISNDFLVRLEMLIGTTSIFEKLDVVDGVLIFLKLDVLH